MTTAAPTPGFIVANRSNPVLNAQHILHGYNQFNAGAYEEAMMYFQLTEADPLQILSLFPDVLPTSIGDTSLGTQSPFACLPSLANIRHPVPVQKVQGEERLFRALSAFIPYLAQIQNRLRLTLENMFSQNGKDHDTDDTAAGRKKQQQQSNSRNNNKSSTPSKSGSSTSSSATDPNLALAILIDTVLLKAYLLCDIPLLPFLSSPYNLCDIDECANILRAYEKYTELIAFYKFRARHGQALELLCTLGQQTAAKSKTAPNTAAPAGSNATSSSSFQSTPSGLSGTEPSIKYLQELAVNINQPCYHWSLSEENDGVRIPEFTPTLALEPNPDTIIALILHYSKWILAADVDDGLRIFTFCHTMNMRPIEKRSAQSAASSDSSTSIVHSHQHHRDHCIPSSIVLEHLKKIADREACIAYLESLINHVGETDSLFHNELVFLYLESIQKLLRAKEQRDTKAAAATEQERLDSVAEVPVRRGARRTPSNAGSAAASSSAPVTNAAPSRDTSRLHILRRKLLDFLRSSSHYTAEKMLSRFPRNALLEERAILLSRINQHREALNIYAHDLHDTLQAEAYAEEHYNHAMRQQALLGKNDGSTNLMSSAAIQQGKDMYLTLLQVYMKPSSVAEETNGTNGTSKSSSSASSSSAASAASSAQTQAQSAPMLEAALLLLSKYYDRISPVSALEIISPHTSLQLLWPYFEKLLCHMTHKHRDEQITKSLLKSEYYAMKESYLLASRGRVVVDSNTICNRCQKKLGNSAFARYPNGAIVHYVCHQQSLIGQAQAGIPLKGDL